MKRLQGKRALVTGGTRGIGRGIVEALVDEGAKVLVLARDRIRLNELAERSGVETRSGDVGEEGLARALLAEHRPEILILNAGARPPMAPIDTISWSDFNVAWEHDVKAALFWVQAALATPLPRGSRVLLGGSGASLNGSPMSGGYAAAKRMLWLMASYANGIAAERKLEIQFQVLVPMQVMDTDFGRGVAEIYAKKRGVTVADYFAGFGKPLTPRAIGGHVVEILTDPQYAGGVAFGVKGDSGLSSLDK